MQTPIAGQDKESELDVEKHLVGLDHAALVSLVLDAMDDNPDFARRVRLDAVRSAPSASHIHEFKEALDDAFRAGDYVDYRAAYDFCCGIEDVLDSIGQFLTAESAQTVIDLTEYAATKLSDAIQYVDDSDGYFGSISEHIAELHHAACVEAKPEPGLLAERLFRLERHGGDLDTFHDSAVTYKALLKKTGLRRFRELVEDEWANVPALGPDDRHDYKRYRITHMMKAIARLTGSVDDVVAIRAKDLSSPWAYVGIVEEFRNARRFTDALTWAQRGIDTFGAAADHRLTECAAQEYERAGKPGIAVDLLWQSFDDRPDFAHYQRLCEFAKRARAWDKVRGKALKRIRSEIKGVTPPPKTPAARVTIRRARTATLARSFGYFNDASTLVQILLWEKDIEGAWREAKSGGCNRRLWMELATKYEKGHPLEVVPVYKDEIESTIAVMNNRSYADAVKLLVHVRKLLKAGGKTSEFDDYIEDVRTRHKPKRNLMKLFADHGWL